MYGDGAVCFSIESISNNKKPMSVVVRVMRSLIFPFFRPIALFHKCDATACSTNVFPKNSQHYQILCRYITDDVSRLSLYERKADETLESLCEQTEDVLCSCQKLNDYDVCLSSGVLTIDLGDHGTYVINKQSANQQIWLSSPHSGPKRYDLKNGRWVYQKDGHTLDQLMSQELSDLVGETIKIESP